MTYFTPSNDRPVISSLVMLVLLIHFGVSASANPIALEGLSTCAKETKDTIRLACYDKIMQALPIDKNVKPSLSKDVSSIQELPSAESSLGLERLRRSTHNKGNTDVIMQLVAAKKDSKKRWVFEFSNQQVWKQIEPQYLPRPPHFPASVRISPGVFGSYDLRADFYSKKVKVKRVR